MAKKSASKSKVSPDGPGANASLAGAESPQRGVTQLDQVLGQSAAKRVVQSALVSGRVHHAWIFHGPTGVGKQSAAVALAATLLDPTTAKQPTGDIGPDADSPVQRLVKAGTHPDLIVVSKELAAVSSDDRTRSGKQMSLPIEVLREFLIEPATKSRVFVPVSESGQGKSLASRVFIVDEAELMDPRTQNVLLKTLEEPPPGCVIILVTSSEERLLPTIRSRCQRVGFAPLSDAEMEAWLSQAPEARAGREVSDQERAWVLRHAGGSPGTAATAIEHELFAWDAMLSPLFDQAYRGSFPGEMGPVLAKLIGERAEAAVKGRPEASKDAANKAWARRMFAYIASDASRRLRAGASGGPSGAVMITRALQALDAVSAAEGHLASNVNLGLLLENLVAQISGELLPS